MHPHLKRNWSMPLAPPRYPQPTALKVLLDAGHRWHLDFSRPNGADRWYASDAERCPPLEWPWLDAFMPDEADWRAIGFTHVAATRDQPNRAVDSDKSALALLAQFEYAADVKHARVEAAAKRLH